MKQILKMLEDPAADCGILNARIWCFENNKEYKSHGYFHHNQWVWVKGSILPQERLIKYTTSLDAAMSIGAEELEGWALSRTVEMLADESLVFSTALTSPDAITQFVNKIEDFASAICRARLKALDYVRGQHV